MKRFITFGSIDQFRTIAKAIEMSTQFIEKTSEGEVILDRKATLPIVDVICSEKIHWTNASVCYWNIDWFWTQSRKKIITIEKDNAWFSFFAHWKEKEFTDIIKKLAKEYKINLSTHIISLYMEWCWWNIQKNSALNWLDKRAIIFQYFKVSPLEPKNDKSKESSTWKETKSNKKYLDSKKNNIFNIMNFPFYTYTIDFSNSDNIQNKLLSLVKETIEPSSPVWEVFWINKNIWEWIVCQFKYKDVLHRFKVKGDKYSVSKVKVKKIDKVDEEKNNIKIEFANLVCTSSRLEQSWQATFWIENEIEYPTIKKMGFFIKETMKDIIKEESDIMRERNLEPKDVWKFISKISRNWFIEKLNWKHL